MAIFQDIPERDELSSAPRGVSSSNTIVHHRNTRPTTILWPHNPDHVAMKLM
jgi:hypothetical protein